MTIDSGFRFDLVGATDLLWLQVGPSDVNIQLRVKGKVMPASDPLPSNASDVHWWRKHLPEGALCFAFAIEGGVVEAYRKEYLDGRWITIGGSGGIYIHDLEAGFGHYADNNLGGAVAGAGRAGFDARRQVVRSVRADVREVLGVHRGDIQKCVTLG